MPDPISNFGEAKLASVGVGAAITSLTLETGSGSYFSDPATLGAFDLLVYDDTVSGGASAAYRAGKAKFVRVTAVSGDTFTVVDGQQGTSDAAIPTANAVAQVFSKGLFDQLASKVVFAEWDASQTGYVPPLGWKAAKILAVGAGGGGASGPKSSSGSAAGGAGGQGGWVCENIVHSATASGNWNITIGAGGTGGASRTANGTGIAAGTAGGDSFVDIGGVRVAFASGGAAATSNTGADNTVGRGTGVGGAGGGSTTSQNGTASPIGRSGAGGGGGGAGTASAPSSRNGGAGSADWIVLRGATTSPGNSPTDLGNPWPGGSGAGGNSSVTGSGQAGGNGFKGGGGGGGGVAFNDLGNSGAGGNGGNGYVAVWFTF